MFPETSSQHLFTRQFDRADDETFEIRRIEYRNRWDPITRKYVHGMVHERAQRMHNVELRGGPGIINRAIYVMRVYRAGVWL